jgi:hypothetical protein
MSEMEAVRSEQNSLGLVEVLPNKLGGYNKRLVLIAVAVTRKQSGSVPRPKTFTRSVPARTATAL